MWDLVGNPEDRFPHNEARFICVENGRDEEEIRRGETQRDGIFRKYLFLEYLHEIISMINTVLCHISYIIRTYPLVNRYINV